MKDFGHLCSNSSVPLGHANAFEPMYRTNGELLKRLLAYLWVILYSTLQCRRQVKDNKHKSLEVSEPRHVATFAPSLRQ